MQILKATNVTWQFSNKEAANFNHVPRYFKVAYMGVVLWPRSNLELLFNFNQVASYKKQLLDRHTIFLFNVDTVITLVNNELMTFMESGIWYHRHQHKAENTLLKK